MELKKGAVKFITIHNRAVNYSEVYYNAVNQSILQLSGSDIVEVFYTTINCSELL